MSWTLLQFIDTGKIFLTAKHKGGYEYRLPIQDTISLSIVQRYDDPNRVDRWCSANVPTDFNIIDRIIIQDKPMIRNVLFDISNTTLNHYSEDFVMDLILEYLQVV